MALIHSLISNSSSPLFKLLGTVSSALNTIGITLTFMLHEFLSYFFPFYDFFSVCKFSIFRELTLGLVFWLMLGDLFVSQNPKEFLWVLFSRADSGLCVYHLIVWSNFNFVHNS